jgi:hypothetical protein
MHDEMDDLKDMEEKLEQEVLRRIDAERALRETEEKLAAALRRLNERIRPADLVDPDVVFSDS